MTAARVKNLSCLSPLQQRDTVASAASDSRTPIAFFAAECVARCAQHDESAVHVWEFQMHDSMPETQQREIFRVLVETQDDRIAVAQSRSLTAARYSLEVEQLVAIERAGVKGNWPPLDITFPTPRFVAQGHEGQSNE